MNDGYMWWLVLVGLGVGVVLTWLSVVRLPRHEYDVEADEREEEATLIAATIESRGGICPAPLALEVLDLHQEYLASPGLPAPHAAHAASAGGPGPA
jgi:hypothetical protein